MMKAKNKKKPRKLLKLGLNHLHWESSPEAIAKEKISIEQTITKAIADAKAMIIEVVENSKVVQTNAPGE